MVVFNHWISSWNDCMMMSHDWMTSSQSWIMISKCFISPFNHIMTLPNHRISVFQHETLKLHGIFCYTQWATAALGPPADGSGPHEGRRWAPGAMAAVLADCGLGGPFPLSPRGSALLSSCSYELLLCWGVSLVSDQAHTTCTISRAKQRYI